MEQLKHECGVAMVRLRKPLSFYEERYGTWQYGLQKLYLLMEKQHNRGQEGAGLACVKMHAEPGEEMIYRERAEGSHAIEEIFASAQGKLVDEEAAADSYHQLPYAGEIYMGHLRYSTTGKRGLSYVHPFMRRSNWKAKNLCVCANFNMTNVPEIFESIASKGQHPRMMSDTFILLEQLGHRLDRESERCFQEAVTRGLRDLEITHYIEENIEIANILRQAAPVWDGGYVVMGATGSGETFTLRDPWGIRPAYWYADEEVMVVASERPVIQTAFGLESSQIHELKPGEALLMRRDGSFRTEQILPARNFSACSFERIYFSRGNDRDIYLERKRLGRQLVPAVVNAVKGELQDTVFSYIPNTAEVAYYGMVEGLREIAPGHEVRTEKVVWKDIKMRTFIAEGNSRNDLAAHVYDISYDSVRPYRDNLVVIDDSIVRGTTLRESIIRILDRLHPKRIVIVSSSPQVRYPDFYGIDMSGMDEFIAFRAAVEMRRERGEEELLYDIYRRCCEQLASEGGELHNCVRDLYRDFSQEDISRKMAEMLRPDDIKAEIKIVFQSLKGLHEACPQTPGDWYFSGHYPTPGGTRRACEAYVRFYEANRELLRQKTLTI
ncbi:MAG: amidophosphoribosyltransferase [Alloprevotella sp.]|nr:amidophosphoribosyltransferase [Alloprevotella sp.]MBR1653240.1 amidophosphoribosyltransferase [Alloprevotella sp.]